MSDSTLLLPNFNNEHVLPHAFEHLRKHIDCGKVCLVAVDDGSEDGGLKVLKDEAARSGFASLEIIERPHEGIVPALNAGLAAVKTEFVFRIDGDAVVQLKGWVDHLKRYLREPDIGLVGGHTIFDSGLVHGFGRSVISEFGLYDMGAFPVEPVGSRTLDSNVYRPVRDFPGGAPYEVDTVLATCIGFRLEDARAIGGFDMRFNPVWIEDDDFGLSVRRLGKKVVVDPALKILHEVSLRGSRTPGQTEAAAGRPTRERTASGWRAFRQQLYHALNPAAVNFAAVKGKFQIGTSEWRMQILASHYGKWREKWGFDPLNPDLGAVFERYYDTEVCWHYNRERYLAGRQLIARIAGS